MVSNSEEKCLQVHLVAIQYLFLAVRVLVVFHSFVEAELLDALLKEDLAPEVVGLLAVAEDEIESVDDKFPNVPIHVPLQSLSHVLLDFLQLLLVDVLLLGDQI